MRPPQAATSPQPPAGGAAGLTSASLMMVPASLMTIATDSLSPTSRPRRAGLALAYSCRTESFASTKEICVTRAIGAAPFSQSLFRHSAADPVGSSRHGHLRFGLAGALSHLQAWWA